MARQTSGRSARSVAQPRLHALEAPRRGGARLAGVGRAPPRRPCRRPASARRPRCRRRRRTPRPSRGSGRVAATRRALSACRRVSRPRARRGRRAPGPACRTAGSAVATGPACSGQRLQVGDQEPRLAPRREVEPRHRLGVRRKPLLERVVEAVQAFQQVAVGRPATPVARRCRAAPPAARDAARCAGAAPASFREGPVRTTSRSYALGVECREPLGLVVERPPRRAVELRPRVQRDPPVLVPPLAGDRAVDQERRRPRGAS